LTLSRSRDDISRLIESFQGVSEALQNLDAPQDALNHIVEYAVLQTGAERGVLLVPAGGVDRLNIRANYNCDEPSLEDIRDFSTSVAESASKDETSVIIENALEDKRTKKYKSIIRHNILSVACVPVRNRGKFVGILYLDHHTIPTLFDERDLEFIRAMANFIGVIVGVIELQKDLTLTRNGVVRTASKPGEGEQFVTRNAQLMEQIAKLKAIAVSDVVVLIRGETGTGKELIARAIHENSSRSIKPMVSFNCAQITENLADSILFGVAHGAVTGVLGKEGLFAEAEGSTLFLDEIGNLDYNVQDKLLRVLEYGEYTAVGTNRPRFADVRVICATNKDLENLQNTGEFRADLYYRINTVTFTIPPLRRRGEDVDLYIDYFGKRLEEKYETRITFTDAARKALRLYSWPGNVRELKNCLESFYVQGTARQIDYGDLPSGIRDQVKEKFKKFKYDAQVLRQLLEKHKGNVSGVARELGISESTLRSILKKSEIDPNDYRR
jgi:transcriptional regulator with GAF, ATPase, and Fis domain